VAEGTYGPITLQSDVKVVGGFAGVETVASQADPDAHKTYINGQGKARAVQSGGDDSGTALRGFHITGGFVEFPAYGGGAYLEDSDAMFVQCTFTGNSAKAGGGAVAILGGSPSFINCRFLGNDGGWLAGAVFSRNGATPTFVDCLFHDNKASEAGAVSVHSGTPRFTNCTFVQNEATVGRGGALFDGAGGGVLRNCILWDNESPVPKAGEIFSVQVAGKITDAAHSNVKGGWSGDGNLNADPLFTDAANGDFTLKSGSPCLSAGLRTYLPVDTADLDVDGNASEAFPHDLGGRVQPEGNAIGMGAYWANP
jgi:hypothetical protein